MSTPGSASEKKSVIVAGGGGFLGSHLCDALINEGHTVFCVDNFGSGRPENVNHLFSYPSFNLIEADIRESPNLPPADEIYHLASRASPKDFTEYPVQIALTNTEGTRNLLDYAVESDAKMVYASTSEVYGDPEVHPQPETYTGNVNIRGPRGCYDESKRFGETLTVAYEQKYDVDVRTARIFNSYGPRMRINDGRVVPTFITQALTGKDITIYGDGQQTRSFCYVRDTVAGLRAVMNASGLKGDVVNIGRSNEITIEYLAEMIVDLTDTDSVAVYKSLPEDDPQRRCPDLSKTLDLLNWEPKVPLEEGLESTLANFSERLSEEVDNK